MARRQVPEEEEGGYSWMDTYGDMVTLLLCFFVLLYSFSSIDTGKWQELVGAFSGRYGAGEVVTFDAADIRQEAIPEIDAMVNYASRDEGNFVPNVEQDRIDNDFDLLYQIITRYITEQGLEGSLSVSRSDDAIYLRFSEMALFNPGRAVILPESAVTLEHILQIIHLNSRSVSMVKIEGHTDDVPINTVEFADNWDLSVKRATNTLRLVLATGLFDEKKLSAVGYGEYQPIATNRTTEGRAQNRRVDFVLMKETPS